MGRIKTLITIGLVFLLPPTTGCRQPSQCEERERAACEATTVTIEYFNQGKDAAPYHIEDCLSLIPLRCPPGAP